MVMPKVSFVRKIGVRALCCHEAAIVKVEDGMDRFHLRMGHAKDDRDLYFDDNFLVSANIDGCPTCEAFLGRGYGEGVMNSAECRAVGDSLNGPYDGLEAATRNLAPILGLFSSGYYVLADWDQYPTTWGMGGGFDDFMLGGNCPYETGIRFCGGCQMDEMHFAPMFLWASQSPLRMDWNRVRHYMEVFKAERVDLPRPVAVFMNGGMSLVLDGHHKLAAAAMLGRTLRASLIFKLANPDSVEQALQQGGKLFLCTPGTRAIFKRDAHTGDECLEYDIVFGPVFICDSHENVLSKAECWDAATPLPKVEPMASRLGAWEDAMGADNEFVKNYKPARMFFPLGYDINKGTHVYLNYIRRSLVNLRKTYERLHSLTLDGLRMAEDLILYKTLFPKEKWVSEAELAWLQGAVSVTRLAEYGLLMDERADGTFVVSVSKSHHR